MGDMQFNGTPEEWDALVKKNRERTQTAVEWLMEKYNSRQVYEESIWDEEFQQAKQMEKEQIIKAVDSNFSYDNNGYSTLGEQYYNETYNK
jgi:hypothetical protein